MSCSVVGSICLRVGDEHKPYAIDLTRFCTNYFVPGEIYVLTERVRPNETDAGGDGPTGYEYEVTTAGQAGDEPSWPTTIGGTVQTGSVVFTCRAIGNNSLAKTITNSDWAAPLGIVIDGEAMVTINGEQKTLAFLSATQEMNKQEVVNTVTFSDGHVEDFILKVSAE